MSSFVRQFLAPDTSPRRSDSIINFAEWIQMLQSSFPLVNTTMQGSREEIESSYAGYVQGVYRSNGPAFACILTKFLLFSQARFQFQQLRGGRPGNLFGTPELALLERPERGKVTADLLARMELHADFAGNGFVAHRKTKLKTMRPDWVSIVLGSQDSPRSAERAASAADLDAEIIGFAYQPGGRGSGEKVQVLLAEEVAHYAPVPDPLASYRGMSWITPILREIAGDTAATIHKLEFFQNAATPNLAVTLPDSLTPEDAAEWIELFEQDHTGVLNAYKTIYFGGGADAKPIGFDFQKMTFKELQGQMETRIASASGMHPVVAALSEGMQGSSLNAGNFDSAARLTADKALWPRWGNAAASLEQVTVVPPVCRLWIDHRDIPFLRKDAKDAAEIIGSHAQSIRTLTDGGYKAVSVVDAITSGDMNRLEHTGFLPVQVQPIQAPDAKTPKDPAATPPARGYERVGEPTERRTYRAPGTYRALCDFWPVTGTLEGEGIARGTLLEHDDPAVRQFPSMFELAQVTVTPAPRAQLGPGPEYIVSREMVLAKKAELQAAGRSAGHGSLARALGVSSATIRRRLAGT